MWACWHPCPVPHYPISDFMRQRYCSTGLEEGLCMPALQKSEKSSAVYYRLVILMCYQQDNGPLFDEWIDGIRTDLFNTNQHGFRRNRGCEKQLIKLIADIINNLDDGQETEPCVLDFSKTFDKVNHNKLLQKQTHYGVSYQPIAWIEDFLSGRTQVVVDGKESTESPVTSGSVLGPAMFLLYINDLPNELGSAVRLFADDTIVYNTNNHQKLQDDLPKLEQLERLWGMEFHLIRCQEIFFSRKSESLQNYLSFSMVPRYPRLTASSTSGRYRLKGKLGCSCNQHCGQGAFKSRVVRRNILTTSDQVKSTAYKQLVRPVLEYTSTSWDSAFDTATSRLEAVQRRAARLICGIRRTDWATSTTGLLQWLNL